MGPRSPRTSVRGVWRARVGVQPCQNIDTCLTDARSPLLDHSDLDLRLLRPEAIGDPKHEWSRQGCGVYRVGCQLLSCSIASPSNPSKAGAARQVMSINSTGTSMAKALVPKKHVEITQTAVVSNSPCGAASARHRLPVPCIGCRTWWITQTVRGTYHLPRSKSYLIERWVGGLSRHSACCLPRIQFPSAHVSITSTQILVQLHWRGMREEGRVGGGHRHQLTESETNEDGMQY